MKPLNSLLTIALTTLCLAAPASAEEPAAAGSAAPATQGQMQHQMGQGGTEGMQGMQNMQEMHKKMQEMHKGMNMQGGQSSMQECPNGKDCPAASGSGGMSGMQGHDMGSAPK